MCGPTIQHVDVLVVHAKSVTCQEIGHFRGLRTTFCECSKQTQTPLKQTKLNAVHLYCILITKGIFLHFVIVGLYTNVAKGHTTVVMILLYLLGFQNTVLQ